jgi:hypothetical protein
MEIHRLENAGVGISVAKHYVPGVDIAPREIVEKKTKMVLGFVWQLIVRFQILTDEADGNSGGNVMAKARKKVLGWWKEQLAEYAPDIVVGDSVEDSFSDGMAILALLHKLNASIVNLDEAKQRRREGGHDGRRDNLELAFSLAQEHLKIVPLLDANDMCAEDEHARPDEQVRRGVRVALRVY